MLTSAATGRTISLRLWSRSCLGRLAVATPCRFFVARQNDDDNAEAEDDDDDGLFAKEEIPVTGEWAGCKRSFMAPLRINTRGSETLYSRTYTDFFFYL